MEALEHYNTGMEFAQSSNTKFFARDRGRIETRFSKDQTTTLQGLKEFPSTWLHHSCNQTTQHHSSQRWGLHKTSGRVEEVTEEGTRKDDVED